MSDNPEQIKVALFLTITGPEALEVYNTFTFTEDERGKLQPVIDKFEAQCNHPTNRDLRDISTVVECSRKEKQLSSSLLTSKQGTAL